MKTKKREIGDRGEQIACEFLMKRGFEVLERNYLRKWGEIDIVVRKGGKLHFVEVKTVSHVTAGYRAEDNLHFWKLERLSRVIQTFLMGYRDVSYVTDREVDWQFDVITVCLSAETGACEVRYLEDIII